MCSYCGCRALEPIARLTDEHEQIQNLCGEVARRVEQGEHAAAVALAEQLRERLRVHDAIEERSVYPAMARLPEYADKVGTLFDEHDDVDSVLDAALSAASSDGASSVDWAPVLATFDVLVEHIQHEENGVFPAAAIALDAADWEHAQRVRAEVTRSDAVEALQRWQDCGGVWRVVARSAAGVTVALCRCDAGEEVDRITSHDPALPAFLAGRTSSED